MKSMTQLLTMATLTLAAMLISAQAQARVLCIDATSTDTGYLVEIGDNREAAMVKKVTLAGTTDVVELSCSRVDSDPLSAAPGSDALVCRRTDTVDHGFVTTVGSVDCDGKVNARLEEMSIAGPRLVSDLVCYHLN